MSFSNIKIAYFIITFHILSKKFELAQVYLFILVLGVGEKREDEGERGGKGMGN